MTLQEFYAQVEGDYEDVLSRLMNEERVLKFVRRVGDDTSVANMAVDFENKDYEAAFREAHTLKGVALNLGLSKLADDASELTECLRGGEPKGDYLGLYEKVKADFKQVVEALKELA